MTQCTELWVDRGNYRNTKIVTEASCPLKDGEILVAIDKFALTANNVSYALSGDMIGYWKFYPAADNWGKVPVWGCANVVTSKCQDVTVGERLWGFFPMASHAILEPGKIKAEYFRDVAAHRADLPGPSLYSSYRRTQAEPDSVQKFENQRCLLFPLFATSFIIYDYLIDNDFFGAQQVVVGSASSKTGFGLTMMLHNNSSVSQTVIGVTSARNKEFVDSLDCCDHIILYGEETQLDSTLATAYVDMSGDMKLTTALHHHLGANMVESCMVGASHWESGGDVGKLPGAKPSFFFAPSQIAKRDQEWGHGVAMTKAMEASFTIASKVKDVMQVEWINGPEAVNAAWQDLLDNKVSGSTGIMASMLAGS
ncbi:MAG: hypothetical protein ACI9SK_002533 [Zhongshania sp.]|jgi:hypothetical protein